MMQGVKKDRKDFSEEMTFELGYKSCIGANKVNEGKDEHCMQRKRVHKDCCRKGH